jgi:hypothetical protein
MTGLKVSDRIQQQQMQRKTHDRVHAPPDPTPLTEFMHRPIQQPLTMID